MSSQLPLDALQSAVATSAAEMREYLSIDSFLDQLVVRNVINETEADSLTSSSTPSFSASPPSSSASSSSPDFVALTEHSQTARFVAILQRKEKSIHQLRAFLQILDSHLEYQWLSTRMKMRAALAACQVEINQLDSTLLTELCTQCSDSDDDEEEDADASGTGGGRRRPLDSVSHAEAFQLLCSNEEHFQHFAAILEEKGHFPLVDKLNTLSEQEEFVNEIDGDMRSTSFLPVHVYRVWERATGFKYIRKDIHLAHVNEQEVQSELATLLQTDVQLKANQLSYSKKTWRRGNTLCMVSEYIDGDSLADKLVRETSLQDDALLLTSIRMIVDAVAEYQKEQLVHGNLKPTNIFYTTNGNVRLVDVALVGILSCPAYRASLRTLRPLYVAPEVIRGEVTTMASDVWSLGAIINEMTKEKPGSKSWSPNRSALRAILSKVVAEMMHDDPSKRPHPEDVMTRLRLSTEIGPWENSIPPEQSLKERYTDIKYVGHGAFATVYRVRTRDAARDCIAKAMSLHYLGNETHQYTAQKEAWILASMKHLNIVEYLDFFMKNSYLFIIMEYCESGSLRKRINQRRLHGRPFEEPLLFKWLTQLALALDHIHSRYILHRDLKPENIFLTTDDTLKIGDFGIATLLTDSIGQTHGRVGTLQYVAPEIVEDKEYGIPSDLWSFGAVLHELISLRPTFEASNDVALMFKIVQGLKGQPLPESTKPEIRKLIDELMSREPESRPRCKKILDLEFLRPYVVEYQSLANLRQRSTSRSISSQISKTVENHQRLAVVICHSTLNGPLALHTYVLNKEKNDWQLIHNSIEGEEGPLFVPFGSLVVPTTKGGALLVNPQKKWSLLTKDVCSGRWVMVPGPREPRFGANGIYRHGMVYLIGGTNTQPVTTVERFDVESQSWSTIAPLPHPGYRPAVAFWPAKNAIAVLGGQSQSGSWMSHLQTLNESGEWTVTKNAVRDTEGSLSGCEWHGEALFSLKGNVASMQMKDGRIDMIHRAVAPTPCSDSMAVWGDKAVVACWERVWLIDPETGIIEELPPLHIKHEQMAGFLVVADDESQR